MEVTFSNLEVPKGKSAIVIGLTESAKPGKIASKIDTKTSGAITKAIDLKKFKGKTDETLTINAPSGINAPAIILIGLGKEKKLSDLEAQSIGGKLLPKLNSEKIEKTSLIIENIKNVAERASNIAYGAKLRSYRFDKYKTKEKSDKKPTFAKLEIVTEDKKKAAKIFDTLNSIAKGVFLARDVVTEPPNHLYPESYAQIIKKELTASGAKVKILGEKQLEKLGMGALLGVGQGSIRESQVVAIEWNGDKNKKNAPVAFVGKGVTFDTGGISIKPSAGMEDMKYDMGGSASVVGVMKALAERKAKINAVGVVGLVENMPGHNAQRPSDVVTSMSGQTVEVLNTDAEGRLVLADALWYCQETYKPKFVINLATLTGAIVIALGDQYAGIFSNNDELSERLFKSGEKTGEKVWRFPLNEEYDKLLDSPIADMQNISSGRGAGSITAAQFLQRFIKDKTPWTHIDIAGMAWTKKNLDTCPEGATAFGVRLLDKLVEEYYESK